MPPVDAAQGLERRFAEEVTLHQVDTRAAQEVALFCGFDALRKGADAKRLTNRHDTHNDGLFWLAGVDAAHELHIDLYDVGLILGEQVQPGVARTKVVDRRAKAEATVFVENVDQVRSISNLFAFGPSKMICSTGNRCASAASKVVWMQASGRYTAFGKKLIDNGTFIPNAAAPRMASTRQDWSKTYRLVAVTCESTEYADSPLGPRTSASCATMNRFDRSTIG